MVQPDVRLESLLARYVERRLAGLAPPEPAELCSECPELVEPLREGVARYEAVAAVLSDSGIDAALELAAQRCGLPAKSLDATVTLAADSGAGTARPAFVAGQTLGRRYRIRSFLGRGGLGEVWRALDLKLRLDVALKAVRSDLAAESQILERFRDEVRLARSVLSPNVCRIYDLVEVDGHELVSMEYVDGETLYQLVADQGPLAVDAAMGLATQLLAGLEAVHAAGLVHRDVKPENVMVTRSGRVVLMDLGLARPQQADLSASISGTPAYMAPEQASGTLVDARADLFSAAMLFAEVLHPEGIKDRESRERLWQAVRRQPPKLSDTPWTPVLRRSLAIDPDRRHGSARDLAHSLEEATRRVVGVRESSPYPGLSSFTESEAKHFYGREVEVESLWQNLHEAHLLALIGASGAGKSSFVRAGVVPSRPEGWRCLVFRPGPSPFVALADALVPEMKGNTEAIQELLHFDDPQVALQALARWRLQHAETLLIIDQFEELYTLNPRETQSGFADLVGRLTLEADVRVLLVLRDDFLLRCHDQPALRPVFFDPTPLKAPVGASLRRALEQPALACGYRFEDRKMVDDMLAAVSEERGALPLLAFTAARLWERRDREQGLLTRASYEAMGGVTGALAQHAEATLSRIGSEHLGVVRELFRNLVTAQGTRASRDRGELLSVFEDREGAAAVLDQLVGARLLTVFTVEKGLEKGLEREGRTGKPGERIEIVHESLLQAWPRLVRWQTQDADSAQLRDQLRQAARLWDERGRSEDLLWSGTAYREYAVWRERYPGGLTSQEEAFAAAMERKAGRRRRRRRLAVTSAFFFLLAVLVTLGLFWRSSEAARENAVAQARRAEASQLLALGRLELDDYPTAALAYALAALERSDDLSSRFLALEALSRGPQAIQLEREVFHTSQPPQTLAFSHDGQYLAAGGHRGSVRVWSRDGAPPARFEPGHEGAVTAVYFSSDSSLLVSIAGTDRTARVWSVPDGELLRTLPAANGWRVGPQRGADRLITVSEHNGAGRLEALTLPSGERTLLGDVPGWVQAVDPTGRWLVHTDSEDGLWIVPLDALSTWPGRQIGRHRESPRTLLFDPLGERLLSVNNSGELRLWSVTAARSEPLVVLTDRDYLHWIPYASFDARGLKIATASSNYVVKVWSLTDPPSVDPLMLRRGETFSAGYPAFDPGGRWLATGDERGVALWPLDDRYPKTLQSQASRISGLVFAPDGSWLAWTGDETLHLWSLNQGSSRRERILLRRPSRLEGLDVDPLGQYLVTGSQGGTGDVYVVPVGGGEPRVLSGLLAESYPVAFGPRGQKVAAAGILRPPRHFALRVWDLETGDSKVLDAGHGVRALRLHFLSDGTLVEAGFGEVRLWRPDQGTYEVLRQGEGWAYYTDSSRDSRYLLVAGAQLETRSQNELVLYDLHQQRSTTLEPIEGPGASMAMSGSGRTIVIGGTEGVVRVGPVGGNELHHLFGHDASVFLVAISPDEQWLATGDNRGVLRLWPMPEGQPLHTLPRQDLLDRLRSLTNLRVVEDPESATGYGLEAQVFAGWR